VGGAAQTKVIKKLSGGIRTDLAQYRELAAFAQFGSDLDKVTQSQLNRGKRLVEILKQGQYQPMRVGLQTVSVYAGTKGFFDNLVVSAVRPFETALHQYLIDEHLELLDRLETASKFDEKLEGDLRNAVTDFKSNYIKDNPTVVVT
jgi:F-type H+-transporting ATPase subunit alpha